MEGAAIRVDLSPSYLPTAHRKGATWPPLEDPGPVPQRHNSDRSRLSHSHRMTGRGISQTKRGWVEAKCEMFKQEFRYLGHVGSAHGVSTDPEVKAVREWPVPETVEDVQAFIGITGSTCQTFPQWPSRSPT